MSVTADVEQAEERTTKTKGMPNLRPGDPIVSIHCSDIHLSHQRPIARSDPDWYEVMRRQLKELSDLQKRYICPVFISGDIFHKWNSPPELINFAIANMPKETWVVAGQHDLPYHNIKDLDKSALGTLIAAGVVRLLKKPIFFHGFTYHGFNWLDEIRPVGDNSRCRNIAIIHSYIWRPGFGHPDAPKERALTAYTEKLKEFEVCFFGDNHIPWTQEIGSNVPGQPKVINCGCFIPRRLDEKKLQPSVWLLHESGKVDRMYLPTARDVWSDLSDLSRELQDSFDAALFVKMLKRVTNGKFDFEEVVRDCMKHESFSEGVKEELYLALGIQDDR